MGKAVIMVIHCSIVRAGQLYSNHHPFSRDTQVGPASRGVMNDKIEKGQVFAAPGRME